MLGHVLKLIVVTNARCRLHGKSLQQHIVEVVDDEHCEQGQAEGDEEEGGVWSLLLLSLWSSVCLRNQGSIATSITERDQKRETSESLDDITFSSWQWSLLCA